MWQTVLVWNVSRREGRCEVMWQDRKPFTPATFAIATLTYLFTPATFAIATLTYNNQPAFASVQFVNRFGWKSQSMHVTSQLIVIDINQSDFNRKSYYKISLGVFLQRGSGAKWCFSHGEIMWFLWELSAPRKPWCPSLLIIPAARKPPFYLLCEEVLISYFLNPRRIIFTRSKIYTALRCPLFQKKWTDTGVERHLIVHRHPEM